MQSFIIFMFVFANSVMIMFYVLLLLLLQTEVNKPCRKGTSSVTPTHDTLPI